MNSLMKSKAATESDWPALAVLVYNLSATGVARNAIRIAEQAARDGLRTELWVWSASGPFQSLVPDNVRVVEFGTFRNRAFHFGLLRRLQVVLCVPGLARLIRTRRPRILLSAGNRCHIAASLAMIVALMPRHTLLVSRASNASPLFLRQDAMARFWIWLDMSKYRLSHRIISVSSELAEVISDICPKLKDRIRVIPNGVDLKKLASQAKAEVQHPFFSDKKSLVIVSAGTITRQKNFPLLIEALSIARRKRDLRLIILGDSAPRDRQLLTALIREKGLEDHVDLAGYEQNPARFFARADVYVLCSLWEGSSNSLLEAMACGAPVVATGCPTGVRELLQDGRMGVIAPPQDAKALADAILKTLEQPRPGRDRQTFMAGFELEKTMRSYLEEFADLLTGSSQDSDTGVSAT